MKCTAILWIFLNRGSGGYYLLGDYYLSISDKKAKLWCLFWFLNFGPLLTERRAWPTCVTLIIWGIQSRPKSLSTEVWADLLDRPPSRKNVFGISRGERHYYPDSRSSFSNVFLKSSLLFGIDFMPFISVLYSLVCLCKPGINCLIHIVIKFRYDFHFVAETF